MMLHISDYYREKNGNVEMELHLKGWHDEESGFHFLYCPSLDITGYGESYVMAKESFEITLKEFLNYTQKKNTFFEELENLGWSVNRKKKRLHSPFMDELLEENETLKELSLNSNVKDEKFDICIA